MTMLHVTPAYGRVYLTTCAAVQDWLAGKDFRIDGTSTYLSIRDSDRLRVDGFEVVRIYSNMLRQHFETKIL